MQTEFPEKLHSLTRVSTAGSWIETLVLTALAIGLGAWLAPDDPLLVHQFPWPLLAVLLAAVRYGFLKGLLSACLLVAALLIFRALGLPAYAELPSTYIIGTLVCAMVVGEFRDLWDRRLEKLHMANTYRQYRLDEFTRAYQVLRISHDLLEQRIAASDQSLRSSLLILRERMRDLKGSEEALVWLAEPFLDLLAQYGALRVAAIYPTDNLGGLQPWPLASIGGMAELEIEDPLVQLCIERRDWSVLVRYISSAVISAAFHPCRPACRWWIPRDGCLRSWPFGICVFHVQRQDPVPADAARRPCC